MIIEAFFKTQWLVSPWGIACEREREIWTKSRGEAEDVRGYVVRMAVELANIGIVDEGIEPKRSAWSEQMMRIIDDQWRLVRVPDPHHEILLRAVQMAQDNSDMEFVFALIRICRTVLVWGRWPATRMEAYDNTDEEDILAFYIAQGRGREAAKAVLASMRAKPSKERLELHALIEGLSDETVKSLVSALRSQPQNCNDDEQEGGA